MMVFVFACVFVITSIWGDCFCGAVQTGMDLGHFIKKGDFSYADTCKNRLEKNTLKKQNYHDLLLDLYSLKENLLGTRVLQKEDTLVVKSDEGTLLGYFQDELSDSRTTEEWITRIRRNQQISENNGARYLYCAVPSKTFYFAPPQNVISFNKKNFESEIKILSDSEIPYMNFVDTLRENGVPDKDIFFITDHHWKPESGFLANKAICQKLNALYGFRYNEAATDIANYHITTYPNCFLGSYGKKAGTFFTWYGADDFDLIIPDFETSLIESIDSESSIREGKFENTVLHMENLKKDYYHSSPYLVYSGGDFRLQIIKNRLNPDGKKIVILRQSFSCVITPFLALQARELHIIDDREGDYPSGERVNVEEYISREKPDYVIEAK